MYINTHTNRPSAYELKKQLKIWCMNWITFVYTTNVESAFNTIRYVKWNCTPPISPSTSLLIISQRKFSRDHRSPKENEIQREGASSRLQRQWNRWNRRRILTTAAQRCMRATLGGREGGRGCGELHRKRKGSVDINVPSMFRSACNSCTSAGKMCSRYTPTGH